MPIDPSALIAPTARVHPDAVIGPGVRIADFCVIESDVAIGAGCAFEPYVFIKRWTTMGEQNEVSAGTVLGSDPLDKNFRGQRSYLRIGNRNKIREHFTISRGTAPESATEIGDDNYIMTSGHIAHNAKIGNGVVIASCALIAGYVEVGDQAFVSGGVAIHQFSRVGRLAMIAGNTGISMDAPPFFTYAGYRSKAVGVNRVGLRRAGFGPERMAQIKRIYGLLYRSRLPLAEALKRIESEIATEDARVLVDFVRRSKRGISRESASASDRVR